MSDTLRVLPAGGDPVTIDRASWRIENKQGVEILAVTSDDEDKTFFVLSHVKGWWWLDDRA